jgi:hypothetical protein
MKNRLFVARPVAALIMFVGFHGYAAVGAVDEEQVKNLESRLAEQEERLRALERKTTGAVQFNPDIGLVADITAHSTQSREDEEGNDKISVREIELIIGHDVDPYSRFDATITLSDFEDVEIEEAYLTHWGVPGGVKARLGRMRPRIGKAGAGHRDQLDTADFPLVVQEYFGVEGLFRTGLELSRVFPGLSEAMTHEITAGVLEGGVGEGGTLLGETRRRPTLFAHLKNFWDFGSQTSFELGFSWLTGSSNEDDDFNVTALGADATFIHRFDAIRRLKLQSELYWQDRDEAAAEGHHHGEEEDEHGEDGAAAAEEAVPFRKNPYGYYALADYRAALRWGCGARFDSVEPVNREEGADDEETAYTAYLTFYQSEFARWRAQYQHAERADGGTDERFWLQLTVAIGVHKHQLQ